MTAGQPKTLVLSRPAPSVYQVIHVKGKAMKLPDNMDLAVHLVETMEW